MIRIVKNLFWISFVVILGCGSLTYGQNHNVAAHYQIDIKNNINNVKAIKLSSIGKELSYIPLETTPKCLIQQIYRIEFSESYIFVKDVNRLLQFDKNGKFLRQIGSEGRGPEEYASNFDFCIDNQRMEIYIVSISQLMIFGFDGVFKNSFKLSSRPTQIIPKDQNYLMFHLMNAPRQNNPSWIITNRQGITAANFKNSLNRISMPGFSVKRTPLYSFNNMVHFMEFGIDTLYYFRNNQKKPYAVFFLGDLKMDPDPLITPSMIKDEKLLSKFWIGSIIEDSNFLFIEFLRGISNSTMHVIFNKRTNDVSILKDDVFINDLGSIGFWPKYIINDKILVDYVDAFDLLKRIIPSNLRSKLTETSNPVLVVLK